MNGIKKSQKKTTRKLLVKKLEVEKQKSPSEQESENE